MIKNRFYKAVKKDRDHILSVFNHHNDKRFKKIIDDYILSSSDDHSLLSAIRNIDIQSRKFGISFYQMIFMLILDDSIDNKNKNN